MKIIKDITVKIEDGHLHVHGGNGMTTIRAKTQEIVLYTQEVDVLINMLTKLKEELKDLNEKNENKI